MKITIVAIATILLPGLLGAGTPYAYELATSGYPAYTATLNIFDWQTRQTVGTIPVKTDSIAIAANPNGKFVYVLNAAKQSISVIETATNLIIKTVYLPKITSQSSPNWSSLAVSPDGKVIWAVHNSGTVAVVCAIANVVLETFQVPKPSGITSLLGPSIDFFSPDGKLAYVAAGSFDSQGNPYALLESIDTTTHAVRHEWIGYGGPAVLSPNGSTLYVLYTNATIDRGTGLVVINTATGQIISNNGVGDGSASDIASSLAITPDGKSLYLALTPQNLTQYPLYLVKYNTASKTFTNVENSGGGQASVTPDGNDLWLAQQDQIEIDSVKTGIPITVLRTPSVYPLQPVVFIH